MKIVLSFLTIFFLSFTHAQWTQIGNRSVTPNYFPLGSFSINANPGGRFLHLMAPDRNPSIFWVGFGQQSSSTAFNDMWKCDVSNGECGWMAGNNTIFDTTSLNTSTISPTARAGINLWIDSDYNFWMYGGQFGRNAAVVTSMTFLGDLWHFNTTDYSWTLISGATVDNIPIEKPFNKYDTIGVQSPTAKPGGRSLSVVWTASNGDLFMFGGNGYSLIEYSGGFVNDIWSYNKTTKYWTYWGGSNSTSAQEQNPNYGTKGVPDALNWPVGRSAAASWFVDDTLYMFGGQVTGVAVVNDVWTWKNNLWTWIGGNKTDFSTINPTIVSANYVDAGHWSSSATAGGRASLMHWLHNDTFFIFGGFGSSGSLVSFNDIWAYDRKKDIWAWLGPTDSSSYYPIPRNAMGFAAIKDKIIMYAGGDVIKQDQYSDMWALDPSLLEILPFVNSSSSSTTDSTFAASTTMSEDNVKSDKKNSNSGKIAAGVLVPILVIGLIGAAIGVYYYRQKKNFHKNVKNMQNEIDMEQAKEVNNRMTLTKHGNMLESVEIKSLIGVGNFGEVFSGKWHNTPVALKKLKPEYFDILKKEADTLLKLRHPQIVQYLGIYKDEGNQHYIVTELMNCGDLQKMLQSGLEITDSNLLQMAVDAASGMAYIHAKNMVHRDCSLRNLLTSRVTSGERKYTTKISDFGMASFVSETYYQSQNRVLPYKWASVEVLKFGKYSSASDVWAFGVTLWELYSLGSQPYPGKTNAEASEAVLAGKRMSKPDRCPNEVYEIMLRCWQEKTKDRPSMVEVYEGLQSLQDKPISNINNNNAKPEEFYTLEQQPEENLMYHK